MTEKVTIGDLFVAYLKFVGKFQRALDFNQWNQSVYFGKKRKVLGNFIERSKISLDLDDLPSEVLAALEVSQKL